MARGLSRRDLDYGIDPELYREKQMTALASGKNAPNWLSGFLAGKNAVEGFQSRSADVGAAEAGKEASTETSYGSVAKGLGDPDDPRFEGATPEQRQQAAGIYREHADKGEKYFMGSGVQEGRDTPFSADEKHLAGLTAKHQYYSNSTAPGSSGKAEMLYELKGVYSDRLRVQKAADKKLDADTRVADLMERGQFLAPGSPEAAKNDALIDGIVTGAYGVVEGAKHRTAAFNLTEGRRKAAIAASEDGWFTAAKSEESALKEYNERFKDGSTAEVEVRNGMRVLVKVDPDGKKTPLGQPYKAWDEGGRQQILGHIPSLAKEGYKLELAHGYKIKEIAAETKKLLAYAGKLGENKEVKIPPALQKDLDSVAARMKASGHPTTGDPKQFEADRQEFNAIIVQIQAAQGKAAKLIPQNRADKGPPAVSPEDLEKMQVSIRERRTADPEFLKLSAKDQAAEISKEMNSILELRRQDFIRNNPDRGLGGGKDDPSKAPPVAGGGVDALRTAAGRPATPPARKRDITKRLPSQELGVDIVRDPMGSGLISAEEYYRKYGEHPPGAGFGTRALSTVKRGLGIGK